MAVSTPSRAKGIIVSTLKWALAAGFLGLVGLLVAVAVAMASLPGYAQLSRRADLGQMVRVRAADGYAAGFAGTKFRPLAQI
jgi:penicillin-binding protein 1A